MFGRDAVIYTAIWLRTCAVRCSTAAPCFTWLTVLTCDTRQSSQSQIRTGASISRWRITGANARDDIAFGHVGGVRLEADLRLSW